MDQERERKLCAVLAVADNRYEQVAEFLTQQGLTPEKQALVFASMSVIAEHVATSAGPPIGTPLPLSVPFKMGLEDAIREIRSFTREKLK